MHEPAETTIARGRMVTADELFRMPAEGVTLDGAPLLP